MDGELELVVHFLAQTRESLVLLSGDLVLIPTGIARAARVVLGHAVEFSPGRFDPTDVCRSRWSHYPF